MYVCLFVCMYVCMYICMYVYIVWGLLLYSSSTTERFACGLRRRASDSLNILVYTGAVRGAGLGRQHLAKNIGFGVFFHCPEKIRLG